MDDIRKNHYPSPGPRSRPGCRPARSRGSCGGWRGALLLLLRPPPVRLRHLLLLGQGQAARRYVLADRGARADGGARAHGDGGDQLHVGADVHIVLDHGAMLVRAVVVAGDGTGADVDVAPDGGVAHVGEVVRLAASPE